MCVCVRVYVCVALVLWLVCLHCKSLLSLGRYTNDVTLATLIEVFSISGGGTTISMATPRAYLAGACGALDCLFAGGCGARERVSVSYVNDVSCVSCVSCAVRVGWCDASVSAHHATSADGNGLSTDAVDIVGGTTDLLGAYNTARLPKAVTNPGFIRSMIRDVMVVGGGDSGGSYASLRLCCF